MGMALAPATAPTMYLSVSATKKLNLADFQNSVPALHELAIVNGTESTVANLVVRLVSEPPFIRPRSWSLDSIRAGETYHLRDLDVQMDK